MKQNRIDNKGRELTVRFVLAVCFFAFSSVSFAINRNYSLAHTISMGNGLPSNTVRHVAQDKYGFLWFGTDNGLCRYDGMFIHKYAIPTSNSSQYVSALVPFGDRLLIGTNSGLWIYDFFKGQFQQLKDKAQDGESIAFEVTSIAQTGDSIVYVSTSGQGIFCYMPAEHRLLHYATQNKEVSKVFVDADDQVWALARVSSANGSPLLWLNHSRNKFESVRLAGADVSSLYSLTMMQTHDGALWLGTWAKGLMRLSPSAGGTMSSHSVVNLQLATADASAMHIHALYDLSPECILIGCDNGLTAYNPQTGAVSAMPLSGSGESPHFIYDIITDREGGLWTSSFYDGVQYFSEVPNRFRSFSKQAGLSGNVINRFCEDAYGRVWTASDDGGLNLFIPATQQISDYPNRALLSSKNVHALSIDGDNLWIGTYSDGIYLLNIKTGALQHRLDVVNETSAYSILTDSHGNHWVGTMSEVSLLKDFTSQPLVRKQLGALVIDIDEDAQGNVWFSTHGAGLWRFISHTGKWKQYFPGKDKNEKNSNEDINCMCIDASNRIYVASGTHLYTYNKKTDAFAEVDLEASASDITSIIEDQGLLWLTSATQLISFTPGKDITHYGEGDGIHCGQFMPNAICRTSDGQLFFGSTHGFTCFYPHSIKPNKQAFPVSITQVEIFDHDIEDTNEDASIPMPFRSEIRLSHNDNMLTIHFAGLSYVSPSMNRYAYMLEGFDKKWNYTTGEGKAVYTNLSPGTYTFHVKAANNDGIWSEQEATLTIVITPPFWWNPFAWILYICLIVAAVVLYLRRWKRQQEEKHHQEMHELDVKRQSEVRDMQLRFYTTIAHEIRTPVSLIIGPMESINEKLISAASTPIGNFRDVLSVVYRNANRLLELVNQLLDFNKVQQGQNMHFALCNIHDLMRNVTDRFIPALQQQNVSFQLIMPDEDVNAVIDSEAITKVVSNLMTNARKYTRSRVVATLATVGADEFSISVEDDGLGINQSDMKRIFTPFFQARNNKPGTGIGLSIVKNLVDIHHGSINVESEEGKSSKFIVTLPLHQPDAVIGEAVAIKTETVSIEPVKMPEVTPASADMEEIIGSGLLLIVEDDYDMLHFLTDNFKSEYKVITAENGLKGVEQVQHNDVSLIISDWMMPEMDGREFCQRIRQNSATSHIPFVMLTARTDSDSKTEGMNCGADAYIEKPFSIKYLNACIHNILEMRRLLFRKFSSSVETKIEEMAPTPADNEFLKKIDEVIGENIANADFNVNSLAAALGVSRSGLFGKIKGIADATPNEMIMVVRLRKAAAMLLEGDLRVNEVCYQVGFNNPSYFSKCFQKQFGVKPTEYVKNHS